MIPAFLLIRILDLLSTYLCMQKYGGWESIEAAPVSRMLIGAFSYPLFVIFNLTLSLMLAMVIIKLNRAYILKIFMGINSAVVISNVLIFILI
jgi:hypothetical protein